MSISCDCSVDGYEYEYPTIYRESMPIARKTHRCCECGGIIKPGERHHMATGLWDDLWDTYRTCMVCHTIREHYCPNGFIFGTLRNTLKDCLDFDYCEVPENDDEDEVA